MSFAVYFKRQRPCVVKYIYSISIISDLFNSLLKAEDLQSLRYEYDPVEKETVVDQCWFIPQDDAIVLAFSTRLHVAEVMFYCSPEMFYVAKPNKSGERYYYFNHYVQATKVLVSDSNMNFHVDAQDLEANLFGLQRAFFKMKNL